MFTVLPSKPLQELVIEVFEVLRSEGGCGVDGLISNPRARYLPS